MIIPAVPVSGRRGAFVSGSTVFSGDVPSIREPSDYTEAVRAAFDASRETGTMAYLDVDGLADRFMNTDLLKSKRPKGRTVMLITHVESEDDVLDGMCGRFDVLGMPCHTAGRSLMEAALEVSDTAVPVIFCRDGREMTGRSIDTVRAEMRDIGFGMVCFLDTRTLQLRYEDSALSISSDMISIAGSE